MINLVQRLLRRRLQRTVLVGVCLLTLAGCFEPAVTSDETTLSSLTFAAVPGDDAPELAGLGPFRVGVRTLAFEYANQPDVSAAGHVIDDIPVWTRRLEVDVLYPADVAADEPANAVYQGRFETGLIDIQGLPETFEVRGIAVRDAPPISGQRFPLVLVSHGLFNTPGVLSGITENLASKGYVVAAINHRDAEDKPATPLHLFARVLLNRVPDQERILGELMTLAQEQADPLGRAIDIDAIALLGFSMGGYGVLGHAGAGFDAGGGALNLVPSQTLRPQTEGAPEYAQADRSHIDAVVAYAPWGGKAGEVWSDQALANIKAPMLVLAGSQDDVSNYEEGIRRIAAQSTGADRYLLVFQNAQHNLVQVPAPRSAHLDVRSWMTFEDPTWRRTRLLGIGNHFVTAFLDWKLKGMADRSKYLHLPTVASNDGVWDQSVLSDFSDRYADGAKGSVEYWTGFKRRQAVGLELHALGRGQSLP